MGSGAETARETAAALRAAGEKVGVLQVRLSGCLRQTPSSLPCRRSLAPSRYWNRPKSLAPPASRSIRRADTLASRGARRARVDAACHRRALRAVVEGLYPGDGQGRVRRTGEPEPKKSFTIGIKDDVGHTSLPVYPHSPSIRRMWCRRCSTALARRHGGREQEQRQDHRGGRRLYAQGYFVYDLHKSGAQTVSHLRFGPRPIHAPYLIQRASFVACHSFSFVDRIDVLRLAAPGATFLLNSPYGPMKCGTISPTPCRSA